MHTKLKPEAKALFLELLDSHKGFQITGQCRKVRQNGDVCYCAAGLLGLVIHTLTGQGNWYNGIYNYKLPGELDNGWPISDRAMSLITEEPVSETSDQDRVGHKLYIMNDDQNMTFAQIKEWIKENL